LPTPQRVGKWKKDATKFPVSVSYHPKRGAEAIIPKPIIETLRHPDKITYIVNGSKVSVIAGNHRDGEDEADE
jgi:hypothetical protein